MCSIVMICEWFISSARIFALMTASIVSGLAAGCAASTPATAPHTSNDVSSLRVIFNPPMALFHPSLHDDRHRPGTACRRPARDLVGEHVSPGEAALRCVDEAA